MGSKSEYILIISTWPEIKIAQEFATHIIEKQYAACINIIPHIHSIYSWQGKIEMDTECMLYIKTQKKLYSFVEKSLIHAHPYETPEIISIDILQGSAAYLKWISESTQIE